MTPIDFTKTRTEQEIINYWVGLGFLDGINSEELIKIISYAFEYTAQELTLNPEKYNERLYMLVFPIIRRILTNDSDKETLDSVTSHIKFDEEKIKDFSKNIILKLNNDISDFDFDSTHGNVDLEVEFCSMFRFEFNW